MKSSLHILLIDDDEDDYLLTRVLLMEAKGSRFELKWASSYEKALEMVREESFDAMLVDYKLGNRNGLELARQLIRQELSIPIILLTGQGSIEVDIEAMKAGVADYLNKDEANSSLLERTIRYAIERRQNEDALRQANLALGQARDEMEARVWERTQELRQANRSLTELNEELRAEIAERKRFQRELVEIQSRLIDSAEAERLQLSQELHDGPMQDLYAIIFQLHSLAEDTSLEERKELARLLDESLNGVIRSLREIAGELRPPNLTAFGLENAIRGHLEGFSAAQTGLKISLDLMPDQQLLPERVRLALYRIYQVALMNVIRHAQATQVTIRLKLYQNEAVLEVQDNGCGFQSPWRPIDLVREGHLGLAGAQERAQAVGGQLQIESQPGQGTLLRVKVPVNGQADET